MLCLTAADVVELSLVVVEVVVVVVGAGVPEPPDADPEEPVLPAVEAADPPPAEEAGVTGEDATLVAAGSLLLVETGRLAGAGDPNRTSVGRWRSAASAAVCAPVRPSAVAMISPVASTENADTPASCRRVNRIERSEEIIAGVSGFAHWAQNAAPLA